MTDIQITGDIRDKKFHFIAIGGIGMSGLAKYLIEAGCEVSGSDIEKNKYTDKLEKIGAKVYIGHNPDHIQPGQIVIASTAIRKTNPEYVRAKELGLEVYHRSDLLSYISKQFKGKSFFGFSGTHGKTTTSGLCSFILEKIGRNPSFVVGGYVPELNTNAQHKSKDYFVAELDESDGTIVKYAPSINVINNIELDHVDFYSDGFQGIINTFSKFLSGLDNMSKNIINIDNSGSRSLIEDNKDKKFITFGIDNPADYIAKNIRYADLGSTFVVEKSDGKGGINLGEIQMTIPGKHNVYNALAVIAALMENGFSFDEIAPYFKEFTGMGRRFQRVAEFDNIVVIDDYAHHPSEIKTTLDSVKDLSNRTVAIFQPHRYTRLQNFWDEFLTSFDSVDKLIVLDVYGASEDYIEGITSENFAAKLNHKDSVWVGGSIEEACEKILPMLKPYDIVLTLGAGSITKVGPTLKELNDKKVLK